MCRQGGPEIRREQPGMRVAGEAQDAGNGDVGVADRIAVINEGRILTIGTPDAVKQYPDPLVQQFLHADFKRR